MLDFVGRELKRYGEYIIEKYKTISSITFEFSEKRGVYLVSFNYLTESDEEFYIDAIKFEDAMQDLYGDEAPLFCNNEEFFKLSKK